MGRVPGWLHGSPPLLFLAYHCGTFGGLNYG
nr:MAG TPA: hypothetical protein [Caudoviricetes sp.]